MFQTGKSSTTIPHIAAGQTVQDWRRKFLAATETIDDKQRKTIIPKYVHRNDEEVLIAEAVCKKETLVNALKELESRIDGDPSRMTRVNEFWALEPTSTSYIGLASYFFMLKYEAAFAGITNEMLVIKFLNGVLAGEKIYKSNKAKIKADMEISAVTEILSGFSIVSIFV